MASDFVWLLVSVGGAISIGLVAASDPRRVFYPEGTELNEVRRERLCPQQKGDRIGEGMNYLALRSLPDTIFLSNQM